MSDRLDRISPRASWSGGGGEGHGEGGGNGEADGVASTHVGWAQEAQAQAGRESQAAQGAASAQARAVTEAPGACDVASLAPRVEPAVAALLLAHRSQLRARPRPVRLPPRSLLR